MRQPIREDHLEQQAIAWFRELGYAHASGPDLGPGGPSPERTDLRQVVLRGRLQGALRRLNPDIPLAAIGSAVQQLANPAVPELLAANRQLHRWITGGVPVTVMEGNQEVGKLLKVFSFAAPADNDWLVVNQLAVQGSRRRRRPDLVIYGNGLPLAVVELKNPTNEKAHIRRAFHQLQTYKKDIPNLFIANVLLVISDGLEARVGSLSAEEERFLRWRIIDDRNHPDPLGPHRDLETMARGLFQPQRLLEFMGSFCLFEGNGGAVHKKIAAYHQFHAVKAAAEQVVRASRTGGDRKGGVVWHTQGSGKSIEMVFLAGALLKDPRMENPTLVMVTDRQDLDGQLFDVFAGATDLLVERPQQAENRQQLRDLLANRPCGGIIFTTLQKFTPQVEEITFPVLRNHWRTEFKEGIGENMEKSIADRGLPGQKGVCGRLQGLDLCSIEAAEPHLDIPLLSCMGS